MCLFSCSENETVTDQSTLSTGALPVFKGAVVKTASKVAGKYEADIVDVNGNIAKYRIVSISAKISGIDFPAEAVNIVYSLPAKVSLSFDTLAAPFGFTGADVTYGDEFTIIAEATTTDGRVFGGVIPFTNGAVPVASGTNPINNTTADVLNGNFRNALKFSFTVACPSYDQVAMYGTYKVIVDDWDEYASRTPPGFTVQCVAGPRPNSLRFVNFTNIGTDMIVDVDPTTQSCTSPKVRNYNVPYYGYTEPQQEGKSGLVFSCIGIVTLETQQSVAQGTFSGLWTFTLQKQ